MSPISWWRRNWVDALMVSLILLVVGGFVALLLRGTPGLTGGESTPAPQAMATPEINPAMGTTTDLSGSATASNGGVSVEAKPSIAPKKATTSTGESSVSVAGAGQATTAVAKVNKTAIAKVGAKTTVSGQATSAATAKTTSPSSQASTSAQGSKQLGSAKLSVPKLPKAPTAASASQATKTISPAQVMGMDRSSRRINQVQGNQVASRPVSGQAVVLEVPKLRLNVAVPQPRLTQPRLTQPNSGPQLASPVPTPRPPNTTPANPKPSAVKATIAKPSTPKSVVRSPHPPRSVYLRSYRVLVGSFSDSARAQALASGLVAQGLLAKVVPINGRHLVLIGPFKTESAAQSAFEQVRGRQPDAVLFRPNGSKVRANAAPVGSADGSAEVHKPGIATTDGGQYLQLGAFRDSQSADPTVTKLAKLGYQKATNLNTGPDGMLRVLVGPFDASTLEKVRRHLHSQGFRTFIVK